MIRGGEDGLTLACRQPSEVLIIRDDHKPLLFDTSTIPHETIDFSAPMTAKEELQALLADRLSEQEFEHDARVEMAIETLTVREMAFLKEMVEAAQYCKDVSAKHGEDVDPEHTIYSYVPKNFGWFSDAITRLLDKRLIAWSGGNSQTAAYSLTAFGNAVVSSLGARLTV